MQWDLPTFGAPYDIGEPNPEQRKPSKEAMLALYDAHAEADIDWTSQNISDEVSEEAWSRIVATKNQFRNLFDRFSVEEQEELKKYILENTKHSDDKYMYFMMRNNENWFRPGSET